MSRAAPRVVRIQRPRRSPWSARSKAAESSPTTRRAQRHPAISIQASSLPHSAGADARCARPSMLKDLDYRRDGTAIYERSFAIIRAEADLSRFDADEAEVAVRMIHACGQVTAAE